MRRPPYCLQIDTAFDTASLTTLGQQINNTIDWEESTAENRAVIKPGINQQLDNDKRMYAGLDNLLVRRPSKLRARKLAGCADRGSVFLSQTTIADELEKQVPSDVVRTLNVTYFPQLGFLIAAELVEPWNEDTQEGDILEGWKYQFFTE